VKAFADAVALIKPQVGFFERHGSAGMAELERLRREAAAADLIVLAEPNRVVSRRRPPRMPTPGSARRALWPPTP
jgi:hypothetical protein